MPVALPASFVGDRFEHAVAFAMAALRSDRRVSTHATVARLFGICASVLENGGTEDEAIASLLHASVDRRAALQRLSEIRTTFGTHVAAIVEGCNPNIPASGLPAPNTLYDRTRATVERLTGYASASDATLAASVYFVSAADTLYDARLASEELARGGDVFAEREGKKFGSLWAFRALADTFLAFDGGNPELGGPRHLPLALELVERVSLMAGKNVVADELLAAFAIDDTVAVRDKGTLVDPGEGA